MRRSFLIVWSCCCLCFAHAQKVSGYFENYTPQVSKGKIPADFLLSSTEKYKRDRQQVDVNQKRGDRITEDYFYKENSYFVDIIRFNGGILLNDTIGIYLDRIADKLLADDPQLRKRITIYALKSPVVNAFSTDQGLICINMGLIARTKTEEELAFVIAHEIIHFSKKHAISTYLKVSVDAKSSDKYEDNITNYHLYSRAAELEADSLGLNMLINAGYNPAAAISVLDLLSLAGYAYLQSPFSNNIFETESLVFPTEYKLETVDAIIPDDGDDPNASHPGITIRKEALMARIKEPKGNLIQVSPRDEFLFYKNIALFECAHLLNNEGNFQQAAYHSIAMLSVFKNNLYLQRELARALYGIVIIRNRQAASPMAGITGEEQKLDYFLWNQSSLGVTTALLSYTWRLHQLHPEDKDILLYAYGIMCEASQHHKLNRKKFYATDSLMKVRAQEISLSDNTLKNLSSRLLYQKWLDLEQERASPHDYIYFAFTGFVDDTLFTSLFNSSAEYSEGDRKAHDDAIAKIAGNKSPQGLIAAMPFVVAVRIGRSKEELINFSKMEKIRLDLSASIENSGEALDKKIAVMDGSILNDTSVTFFNDMALVNEWSSLCSKFSDTTIPFLPFSLAEVMHVENRYGAGTLMRSGFLHTSETEFREPYHWITFMYIPCLPQALWYTFKPHYKHIYVAEYYDMRTGKLTASHLDLIEKQAYHRGLLASHVFNSIRKLPVFHN